ncbi:hypothetical protein GUJ93_ZPchr0458g22280 [Zizania palustris]|uniref:non-specific serine/threonine protein kinase n=1 Tax=Zizania palustris TaxID=103762 RepID=A0A8J5RBN8_ZIZPA|nr:hypothetical protein GUJ93_ZPchr0458g22280 [Zizania palustris]
MGFRLRFRLRLRVSQLHGSVLLLLLMLLAGVAQAQQAPRTRTDPTEAAALNAVFAKLGQTAQSSWNISGDPCTGAATDGTAIDGNPNFNPAIKCVCTDQNNTVCHITMLKIHAVEAAGQIPEELRNLTRLTSLDLGQNILTGPVPSFIGELTDMQSMTFRINSLSGPIPKEIGNLTKLIKLDLGLNNFNGSLPSEIGNLDKLQELYIDSAGLSGPLPSSLSKLTSMNILWASDNDFTGQMPDYIGSWNLTDLRFQGNSFQGPLPVTLSNLVQLTSLRIGDIENGSSSSLTFISNMTSLSTLILRNCRISDNLASINFSNFASLTFLDLSFNNITGQVPQALLGLNLLKFLFLGNNSLSGSLPSSKGPSLTTLDFSYNQLSGNFPSWASQKNLQLNLVANNFVVDASNNSILPSGLGCLQRNTPCFLGSPQSASFAVNCEFGFEDTQSWKSLGRRAFDIYVQGERKEQNFDIRKSAGGKSYTAVKKQYTVSVTKNFFEVHLFWAGKGTCCIPTQGYYGPTISALSLTPNFPPTKRRKLSLEQQELYSIVGRPNVFSYGELRSATENFSSRNLLGEGGYGSVYKGKLTDGRLYGCCLEGNKPLLVYEYMENGSLDKALFGTSELNLKWPTRFEICLGIARDFGLAKLYDDKKTHVSTKVAGTFGYLAPEYAMREDKIYIFEWAWELYENNNPLGIVDPKLTEFNEEEVLRAIHVALVCTQGSPHQRPSMSRVVSMLTGDMEVTEAVMKPSYISEWQIKGGNTSFMNSNVGGESSSVSGPTSQQASSAFLSSIIPEGR